MHVGLGKSCVHRVVGFVCVCRVGEVVCACRVGETMCVCGAGEGCGGVVVWNSVVWHVVVLIRGFGFLRVYVGLGKDVVVLWWEMEGSYPVLCGGKADLFPHLSFRCVVWIECILFKQGFLVSFSS